MIPIVEYPNVVNASLPFFEDVFTRPQMKNFARYLTGLMISPNHTISYMNSLFYAHNDQSALNNFITDATWSDEELDDARYRYILDRLSRSKDAADGEGILDVDDTLSHKSGESIEFAGSFFDHSENKYTLAHDILTTHLVKGRLSIPLDYEVYLKRSQLSEGYLKSVSRLRSDAAREEYAKETLLDESFKDKNQMVRELISKASSKGVPFSCVVGDSWFFNHDNAEHIQSLKKDWVFESKSNRLVMMPSGYVHLSDWAKTIPKERFISVKARYERKERTFWCCSKNVTMKKQGRVRVLVSYDNPEFSGEPVFLCTNRLDWNEFKIVKVYAKRWRIDAFYRDAKQNLGLEEYEMRKIGGVRRHIAMVFIAHTLLELGSGASKPGIEAAKAGTCLDTIGSRCRIAYTEVLVSFIGLVLSIGERVKDAKKIAAMALSSKVRLGTEFAKV